MTEKLSGKTAIVTGASQGIGLAVARRFFNDGANVVVTYLPEHGQAERVIEQIGGAGDRVLVVAGDLRQVDFVGSLFDQAERRFGAPNIVAAIAGVNLNRPVIDTTEEDYDRIFSINARATFWIFREAARKVSDGGRIIGVSSNMVLQGRAGHALYAGSKAAVEQFVRTLAKELGARGITVNAVAPGPTDTAMVSQLSRDTAPAITPLGRLGQPADIADLIGFLASDDARWITGQVIGVNGGIV
ncbi:MAG TPA: SDR family oxidoreductase [Pseudolabrys sp.]|jgi:3-oxoacyl-[acyl-carrier protein] reductase|nr:SDR family oxidoreductase [Pseudolabrys sp.]